MMEVRSVLSSLKLLGFNYISKDSDGDIMAWEHIPSLETGIHGGQNWLTPDHSGSAYSDKISILSGYIEPCKCHSIADIYNAVKYES